MPADLHAAVSQRPPLGALGDRRRELDAAWSPWVGRTLGGHLDHCVERFGDEPFIVTDDRMWTYGELRDWSRRIAGGLVAMGIASGDHVALVMANYPEFIAVKFAIAEVGAVCVPVNYLLRERELSYVLAQSDAVALITMDTFRDNNYVAMLDSLMPGWESELPTASHPSLRNVVVFAPQGTSGSWRNLDDVGAMAASAELAAVRTRSQAVGVAQNADILYTSGTTGIPKGVMLTHDMLVRTAYASAYSRGLWRGHRSAFALPMYHVFGAIECLLAATFVGGAVVPRAVFDPADLLSCVSRHHLDEIASVPTMTLGLLAEAQRARVDGQPYDLASLRVVYSSGTVAPQTIHAEIRELLAPDELVAGYGQTETTAAMTANVQELGDQHLQTTSGRLRPAGIAGDPALGGVLAVYKSIDPETGADLPRDARGELVVRGPAVTAGYYNKPDETAAAFTVGGWLRTGDIGVVSDEGDIILSGRLKETFRCGGEMVMPAEVERVLAECAGVAQAHVVGLPHPRMGEVGCAVIIAEPGHRPEVADLTAHCNANLARFKVPAHVVFLDASELPMTVTGRVQKFRLAELVATRLGLKH